MTFNSPAAELVTVGGREVDPLKWRLRICGGSVGCARIALMARRMGRNDAVNGVRLGPKVC